MRGLLNHPPVGGGASPALGAAIADALLASGVRVVSSAAVLHQQSTPEQQFRVPYAGFRADGSGSVDDIRGSVAEPGNDGHATSLDGVEIRAERAGLIRGPRERPQHDVQHHDILWPSRLPFGAPPTGARLLHHAREPPVPLPASSTSPIPHPTKTGITQALVADGQSLSSILPPTSMSMGSSSSQAAVAQQSQHIYIVGQDSHSGARRSGGSYPGVSTQGAEGSGAGGAPSSHGSKAVPSAQSSSGLPGSSSNAGGHDPSLLKEGMVPHAPGTGAAAAAASGRTAAAGDGPQHLTAADAPPTPASPEQPPASTSATAAPVDADPLPPPPPSAPVPEAPAPELAELEALLGGGGGGGEVDVRSGGTPSATPFSDPWDVHEGLDATTAGTSAAVAAAAAASVHPAPEHSGQPTPVHGGVLHPPAAGYSAAGAATAADGPGRQVGSRPTSPMAARAASLSRAAQLILSAHETARLQSLSAYQAPPQSDSQGGAAAAADAAARRDGLTADPGRPNVRSLGLAWGPSSALGAGPAGQGSQQQQQQPAGAASSLAPAAAAQVAAESPAGPQAELDGGMSLGWLLGEEAPAAAAAASSSADPAAGAQAEAQGPPQQPAVGGATDAYASGAGGGLSADRAGQRAWDSGVPAAAQGLGHSVELQATAPEDSDQYLSMQRPLRTSTALRNRRRPTPLSAVLSGSSSLPSLSHLRETGGLTLSPQAPQPAGEDSPRAAGPAAVARVEATQGAPVSFAAVPHAAHAHVADMVSLAQRLAAAHAAAQAQQQPQQHLQAALTLSGLALSRLARVRAHTEQVLPLQHEQHEQPGAVGYMDEVPTVTLPLDQEQEEQEAEAAAVAATTDAFAEAEGMQAAQAVAAAELAAAEIGPRYCDEHLTHAPPDAVDEEPYLGDRDEGQRLAAEAARWDVRLSGAVSSTLAAAALAAARAVGGLRAAFGALWRERAGPAGAVSEQQQAEGVRVRKDDELYDDLVASLRTERGPDGLQVDPTATAAAVEAEAAAEARAAAEAAEAEVLLSAEGRVADASAGGPADGVQVLREAAEALQQPAEATSAAEELAPSLIAAAETTAPVTTAAAAEDMQQQQPSTQEQQQQVAGAARSLKDLLRDPQVARMAAAFAEVQARAVWQRQHHRAETRRRLEAAKAAKAAEAAAKAGVKAGAAPAAAPLANALAGLRDVDPLQRALDAAAMDRLLAGLGVPMEEPARPSPAAEQPSMGRSHWAPRPRRHAYAADAAPLTPEQQQETLWAKQMAAIFAQGPGGGVEGQQQAAAPDAAALAYTDESAAGAELELEATSAAPAGRRTLFGEPQQVVLHEGLTVKELAALLGAAPAALETYLTEQLGEQLRGGVNEEVGLEAAELAALEYGKIAVRAVEAADASAAPPRQPVVTILGHVDHGKTSLLDALRRSNVAAGEAGGITQHIGAFEVAVATGGGAAGDEPQHITFVDTPGHEAFSAMRARGAAVTDVAVLVVAADEGVKPQTREALAHARSAGCPVVVAITKCDKATARPEYVKQQLAGEGLDLEDYGGSVQVVHTSATSGEGLKELEEALLLQAELMELRAPLSGRASASVVEARIDVGLGPVATVIVKKGTLKVGDFVVVGTESGRVRTLHTADGRPAPPEGVRPGQCAVLSGLHGLPQAGDEVRVVGSAPGDDARARKLALARRMRQEEFRRMQLAAALAAQRQREAAVLAESYARRRAAKAEVMQLLAERKKHLAERLKERSAAVRAAAAGAPAVAAAAPGDVPGAAERREEGEGPKEAAEGTGEAAAGAQGVARPAVQLNLLVRADVQGSVEAVNSLLQSLAAEAAGDGSSSSTPVSIKVVHSGVGGLTDADIHLAQAAGAHIVLFNTGLTAGTKTEAALRAAQHAGVRVLSHTIVYHLMDAVRKEMEAAVAAAAAGEAGGGGGGAPLGVVGEAEVLATFALSVRKGAVQQGAEPKIAGVRVLSGEVLQAADVWRVVRDGAVLWEGPCSSLRHHKAVVQAATKGTECGVVLGGGAFSDFRVGDRLLCLKRGAAGAGA